MSILLVAVEVYLQSQEWRYKFDEEEEQYSFQMSMKNMQSCKVYISETEDVLLTYAVLPLRVPEPLRDSMSRYIARANYGLILGNFEMDINDGEIRFKTSLLAHDRVPIQSEIERYVDLSYIMLDRYAKGILGILYGGLNDKDAIELVEGAQTRE